MAVIEMYVPRYANDIYNFGTQRFTARDGKSGIAPEYHEPVKQYAAANFYMSVLDTAKTNGWITQEEYDQTVAYRTPASPQGSPSVPGDEPIA